MDEAVNVYQPAVYNGDGSPVASMMWLGYDAPDGPTDSATRTEGRAEDGGGQFADAVDGLRASRPYDDAHLTAIGHSYGSTTVPHAATDHGIDVDDIVLVGSPGAGGGVDHASDLGAGADHVYVGRNSGDIVGALGDHGWVGGGTLGGAGLGNDPSEDDFGAKRFEAEDPTRSGWHRGTAQHERYFEPDSESLYNIGRVVDGSGHVNPADHTSDPWYGPPEDPEIDREPTFDERGRSNTQQGEVGEE
jgi:pimeloyl-ACP methyl ester carboxylesterase